MYFFSIKPFVVWAGAFCVLHAPNWANGLCHWEGLCAAAPFTAGGDCPLGFRALAAAGALRPRRSRPQQGARGEFPAKSFARTSIWRASVTRTERLMRESGTLTATQAPASRQMRATMGAACARSTPVLAYAQSPRCSGGAGLPGKQRGCWVVVGGPRHGPSATGAAPGGALGQQGPSLPPPGFWGNACATAAASGAAAKSEVSAGGRTRRT